MQHSKQSSLILQFVHVLDVAAFSHAVHDVAALGCLGFVEMLKVRQACPAYLQFLLQGGIHLIYLMNLL